MPRWIGPNRARRLLVLAGMRDVRLFVLGHLMLLVVAIVGSIQAAHRREPERQVRAREPGQLDRLSASGSATPSVTSW